MASQPHQCDPATDPRGGNVTRSRVLRLLLGVACRSGEDWSKVLDGIYGCPRCTLAVTGTILGLAVQTATTANPDIVMAWELELAAVQAQLGEL